MAAQVDGIPLTTSPSSSPTVSNFSSRMKSAGSTRSSPPRHSKTISFDTEYKGPIIPPSTKERRKHRTLVLCFDGTGDQFDNDNSNIVQLFALLSKGDWKQQLVYYQAGIGTYTIPQIATPLASKIRKTWDMMLGAACITMSWVDTSSLWSDVRCLLSNLTFFSTPFLTPLKVRTGDKICIFGFSRGAYTARALAGMIEKVGLLPPGNHQQVPFAYKMYMKDDDLGWQQSVLFKKSFSMDVDIEFVGVWDTVDSVGILPRHVPFTKNNTCVKTFRHAISLDEHRVKFKANLFDKAITTEGLNSDISYTPLSQRCTNLKKAFGRIRKKTKVELEIDINKKDDDKYNNGSKLQDKYTDKSKKTDVLEVWFSGCHTDIGGGSVSNDTRHSLARIPLRWMIRECFLTESGIQFEAGRLHEVGLDPQSLYPRVHPRPPPLPVSSVQSPGTELSAKTEKPVKSKLTSKRKHDADHICPSCTPEDPMEGSEVGTDLGMDMPPVNEEHEELHDALSPAFDQLELSKGWWILELLPLVHRHEKQDGSSVKVISVNNGRARVVAQQEKNGIKVHRSVKMRMEAEAKALGKKYNPRVKFHCDPTWVD